MLSEIVKQQIFIEIGIMIGAEFVCLFTGEWGEWLILGCPSPVKVDGQRVFGGGE
jgi:hypothetical protein